MQSIPNAKDRPIVLTRADRANQKVEYPGPPIAVVEGSDRLDERAATAEELT